MNSENNHSNQKMDLRVFKTYKALTEAIFRLLETYDFEDISVNKLCEKAYVGRGTFYKHFADKYEFLSFVIREQYLIYLNKELSSIQSDTPTDYYLGLISICIDFCEQYPLLISAWHQSKSLFILTNVVSEIVIPDIKKRIDIDEKNGYVPPFDSYLSAQLICSIIMDTVTWWYSNQNIISKNEMLTKIRILLSRLIIN